MDKYRSNGNEKSGDYGAPLTEKQKARQRAKNERQAIAQLAPDLKELLLEHRGGSSRQIQQLRAFRHKAVMAPPEPAAQPRRDGPAMSSAQARKERADDRFGGGRSRASADSRWDDAPDRSSTGPGPRTGRTPSPSLALGERAPHPPGGSRSEHGEGSKGEMSRHDRARAVREARDGAAREKLLARQARHSSSERAERPGSAAGSRPSSARLGSSQSAARSSSRGTDSRVSSAESADRFDRHERARLARERQDAESRAKLLNRQARKSKQPSGSSGMTASGGGVPEDAIARLEREIADCTGRSSAALHGLEKRLATLKAAAKREERKRAQHQREVAAENTRPPVDPAAAAAPKPAPRTAPVAAPRPLKSTFKTEAAKHVAAAPRGDRRARQPQWEDAGDFRDAPESHQEPVLAPLSVDSSPVMARRWGSGAGGQQHSHAQPSPGYGYGHQSRVGAAAAPWGNAYST